MKRCRISLSTSKMQDGGGTNNPSSSLQSFANQQNNSFLSWLKQKSLSSLEKEYISKQKKFMQDGGAHGWMDYIQDVNKKVPQTYNPFYNYKTLENTDDINSYTTQDMYGNPFGENQVDVSSIPQGPTSQYPDIYSVYTDNPYVDSIYTLNNRNASKADKIGAGVLLGMNALNSIFERANEKDRENFINRIQNSPYTRFGVDDNIDRGDYMVNAPGVGSQLKPDQHTRIGYGTKIAKDGLEVGNEVDLTPEEIAYYESLGYKFQY